MLSFLHQFQIIIENMGLSNPKAKKKLLNGIFIEVYEYGDMLENDC